MRNVFKMAAKTAAAGAILAASSTQVMAAGAVAIQNFDGGPGANHIGPGGGVLTATAHSASANAWTGNPVLGDSSWGHQGRWYTFDTQSDLDTLITLDGTDIGGISVWSSTGEWDAGTTGSPDGLGPVSGLTNPHSFNSVGNVGDAGTNWMTNMDQSLGYFNSGAASTGEWSETIATGANANNGINVSGMADGISGGTSSTQTWLSLTGLNAGWYAIYVGGTSTSTPAGSINYNLTVSQVPVPAAFWMLGSGLLGLVAVGRRNTGPAAS